MCKETGKRSMFPNKLLRQKSETCIVYWHCLSFTLNSKNVNLIDIFYDWLIYTIRFNSPVYFINYGNISNLRYYEHHRQNTLYDVSIKSLLPSSQLSDKGKKFPVIQAAIEKYHFTTTTTMRADTTSLKVFPLPNLQQSLIIYY